MSFFGASGQTGSELIDQALAAGHEVTAVARQTSSIAPRDGLTVVGADATDADAVDAAVVGNQAVLSALGVSYSRKPINVYSVGAANMIKSMKKHRVKRLVVVSTAPLDPAYRSSDSFFFTKVMEPVFMTRPGRTLYEDNRRMEALVRASGLEWTIVRSCWLFNSARVSDFQIAENSANGMFTARADLAACMLAQLTEDRFVHKTIGVTTTSGTPSIMGQIWREVITREKKR